jgi:hypothetical protein
MLKNSLSSNYFQTTDTLVVTGKSEKILSYGLMAIAGLFCSWYIGKEFIEFKNGKFSLKRKLL